MAELTRKIGATLTWEEYCAEVGVDPQAARDASVTRALWALCGGESAVSERSERAAAERIAAIDTEPTADFYYDHGAGSRNRS